MSLEFKKIESCLADKDSIECLKNLNLISAGTYPGFNSMVDFKLWVLLKRPELANLLLLLEAEGIHLGSWNTFFDFYLNEKKEYELPLNILRKMTSYVNSLQTELPKVLSKLPKVNWEKFDSLVYDKNGYLVSLYDVLIKTPQHIASFVAYFKDSPRVLSNIANSGEKGKQFLVDNKFLVGNQEFVAKGLLLENDDFKLWAFKHIPEWKRIIIYHVAEKLQRDRELTDNDWEIILDLPEIYVNYFRTVIDAADGDTNVLDRLLSKMDPEQLSSSIEHYSIWHRTVKLIYYRPVVQKWMDDNPRFLDTVLGVLLYFSEYEQLAKETWIRYLKNGGSIVEFVHRMTGILSPTHLVWRYSQVEDVDVTKIYERILEEVVQQGYIVSGFGSFANLVEELIRFREPKRRRDWVVNQILDYYKDIEMIVKFSASLLPDDLDTLHIYARSSAVFNEPSKATSFTTSQRQLIVERRRPTDVQAEYINKLDTLFKRAVRTTKGFYAWRGVSVPDINSLDPTLDIFKSLSLSKDVSLSYLREHSCCLLRVYVPPNTPLIAIDPVQEWKKDGGLFEFLLPRSAIFHYVGTITSRGEPSVIYDYRVSIAPDLDDKLHIGRLRKRKMPPQDVPPLIMEKSIVRDVMDKGKKKREKYRFETNVAGNWDYYEDLIIDVMREWRTSSITRHIRITDAHLRQLIPLVRQKTVDALQLFFEKESKTDAEREQWTQVFSKVRDYVSRLTVQHAIDSIKTSKRVRVL